METDYLRWQAQQERRTRWQRTAWAVVSMLALVAALMGGLLLALRDFDDVPGAPLCVIQQP